MTAIFSCLLERRRIAGSESTNDMTVLKRARLITACESLPGRLPDEQDAEKTAPCGISRASLDPARVRATYGRARRPRHCPCTRPRWRARRVARIRSDPRARERTDPSLRAARGQAGGIDLAGPARPAVGCQEGERAAQPAGREDRSRSADRGSAPWLRATDARAPGSCTFASTTATVAPGQADTARKPGGGSPPAVRPRCRHSARSQRRATARRGCGARSERTPPRDGRAPVSIQPDADRRENVLIASTSARGSSTRGELATLRHADDAVALALVSSIVHVLSSYGVGGQERVALDLAIGQRERGHRVAVISLAPAPGRGDGRRVSREHGIDGRSRLSQAGRPRSDPGAAARAARCDDSAPRSSTRTTRTRSSTARSGRCGS